MADTKISDLSAGGNVLSTDQFVVARSGSDYAVLGKAVSVVELIYRYTVAGSDKASIDTGADTADAGSNDWTGGDLLEIWLCARTDEAAVFSQIAVTLNNDTSSIYDRAFDGANNATQQASSGNTQANWDFAYVHGANGSASYPGVLRLSIPNFTGTTFWKVGEATVSMPDATAGNQEVGTWTVGYRSTSAVNRFKVIPTTALKKFKVGSQLLIYKRRSL